MTTEDYELPESLEAYRARAAKEQQLRSEAFARAQKKRENNVIVTVICAFALLVFGALALVWPGARPARYPSGGCLAGSPNSTNR
jgi:hypothetical protein